jgi:hypothetical protein
MKSTSVCTALLAAVGIAACFPDDLTSVDELDTVTTVFKQDADFGALQRYTIADSVLAARYNYPFKAGDYIGGGSRAFQYLSFHIGVAYSQ